MTSPAMLAIEESWIASRNIREVRQRRFAADPTMTRLRAFKAVLEAPINNASELHFNFASGNIGRLARISRLLRARMAMLDGFPHIAREHLADAAMCRSQSRKPIGAS